MTVGWVVVCVVTGSPPAAGEPTASDQGQATPTHAQTEAATPAEAGAKPKGILPIPDYKGDFWERQYLLGDLGGRRTALAEKGVQFNIDFTQTFQAVVSGGRDTEMQYGGTLDYIGSFDLMRMGVLKGALIEFRAETRYGESVLADAGSFIPVSTDMLVPLASEIDEAIPITVTELVYTQFLSEHFGVFVGKIQTFDGDLTEFASGRGISQFMNTSLMFSPGMLLATPYSTLAAGVVWLPCKWATVSSLVMNTKDSSTTTGFPDIGDGSTWSTEAQIQYRLGDLPGGVNIGGMYAWDNNFPNLNSRLIFRPGEGLSIDTNDDTWAIFGTVWQYLIAREPHEGPMNLADGKPDCEGIGLFLRAGTADDDSNPVEWSIGAGIGGRGLIPSRRNDTYGLGYYYVGIEDVRLLSAIGAQDFTQGFEAFYNLAITPAAQLTFDIQLVESAAPGIDTAVILGMRLLLRF